jgi:hypothetical protein
VKKTHVERIEGLPDGAYVALDGQAWLLRGDALLAWGAGGYAGRRARPAAGDVEVLTPPSIVAALRAGYQPALHPTADHG